MPWGSGPLATLVQVPMLLVRLQAWQGWLQALLQQTPWAQIEVEHSLPVEQEAPGGLSPQLLIMLFMPQMLGAMHSALVLQAEKHLLALQW